MFDCEIPNRFEFQRGINSVFVISHLTRVFSQTTLLVIEMKDMRNQWYLADCSITQQ